MFLTIKVCLSLRVEQRKPAKRRSNRECVTCAPAHLNAASEEVFQCEGNCRLHMHRYCVGLPKTQYEELTANSTPFICLVCTQRLHNAQVLVLQNELASLKSELLELRAIIANSSVTQSASPAVHDEISPSAFDHGEELRAVRAEVDKIVAVLNAKPKSYAKVAATQLTRPKRKPCSIEEAVSTQGDP